jgi:hypothetical protein
MTTIKDYIKNAKFVRDNLLDEQERIILKNENKIINLNTEQFEGGIGSNDQFLINKNKRFSGYYRLGEKQGQLYDFYQTGEFLNGMQLEMLPNLTQFSLFSTGTGSGDKKNFFDGYSNLFGLTEQNSDVVNWDIIYPEIMDFIKKYL